MHRCEKLLAGKLGRLGVHTLHSKTPRARPGRQALENPNRNRLGRQASTAAAKRA